MLYRKRDFTEIGTAIKPTLFCEAVFAIVIHSCIPYLIAFFREAYLTIYLPMLSPTKRFLRKNNTVYRNISISKSCTKTTVKLGIKTCTRVTTLNLLAVINETYIPYYQMLKHSIAKAHFT